MLIEPGTKLVLNKPAQSENHLSLLNDIKKIIEAASPWSNQMVIHNKTKGCVVEWQTRDNILTLTVTNPEDEIFKLAPPPDAQCTYKLWPHCCEYHRVKFLEENP